MRAVLFVMFAKHHIAILMCIICFSFLGCSLPLAVNNDLQAVSGGIVPSPTKTQRAMSRFEISPSRGPSVTLRDAGDVISSADGTTSGDPGHNEQLVSPPRFSPLIP